MRGAHRHLAEAAAIGSPHKLASEVKGINAKTAVIVPAVLGSMPFFWFCLLLAVCSLPAVTAAFDHEVLKDAIGLSAFFPSVIEKVSLIALVAWLAQTLIQLVALPVLQVSNNAAMAQQEEHTATIMDELDTKTAGGLKDVLDQVTLVGKSVAELHEKLDSKRKLKP